MVTLLAIYEIQILYWYNQLFFFFEKNLAKMAKKFSFELTWIKKNTWFAFVICDMKSWFYQYSRECWHESHVTSQNTDKWSVHSR